MKLARKGRESALPPGSRVSPHIKRGHRSHQVTSHERVLHSLPQAPNYHAVHRTMVLFIVIQSPSSHGGYESLCATGYGSDAAWTGLKPALEVSRAPAHDCCQVATVCFQRSSTSGTLCLKVDSRCQDSDSRLIINSNYISFTMIPDDIK